MIKPKYEVLYRPRPGGGGPDIPDHQASAMKYFADTLLYLDEKNAKERKHMKHIGTLGRIWGAGCDKMHGGGGS